MGSKCRTRAEMPGLERSYLVPCYINSKGSLEILTPVRGLVYNILFVMSFCVSPRWATVLGRPTAVCWELAASVASTCCKERTESSEKVSKVTGHSQVGPPRGFLREFARRTCYHFSCTTSTPVKRRSSKRNGIRDFACRVVAAILGTWWSTPTPNLGPMGQDVRWTARAFQSFCLLLDAFRRQE